MFAQQRKWLWATLFILLSIILSIGIWLVKNRKIRQQLNKIQTQQALLFEQENKNRDEKIKFQNRELTAKAMYLHEKNVLIEKTVQKLNIFKKHLAPQVRKEYAHILTELTNSQTEDSWEAFEKYFLETHQGFYEKLNQLYPDLTPGEKKLCAFLRLNLSSKEIATLQHLSPKSVEVARSRLRKKLNLTDTNTSLVKFLTTV